MTQLARLKEWVPSGREAVLGPHMLALVDWVDSKFVELAIKARAQELPVPSLIERSILERAGYFESFPGSTVEQSEGGCMPPAVCYHCYAKLAATSLQEPGLWTCIARCRRWTGRTGNASTTSPTSSPSCSRRGSGRPPFRSTGGVRWDSTRGADLLQRPGSCGDASSSGTWRTA